MIMLFRVYLAKLEAGAPLFQRDKVIVVDVTAIEERLDAMFQCDQRGADREKFMTRDFPVLGQ